jgi:hypothetical protein
LRQAITITIRRIPPPATQAANAIGRLPGTAFATNGGTPGKATTGSITTRRH